MLINCSFDVSPKIRLAFALVSRTSGPSVMSNDSNLSTMTISIGTLNPTFNTATTSYSIYLANSISTFSLIPTATNSFATIRVNGQSVISGVSLNNLSLSVGVNTITIIVTAQNGSIKTYTITITRLADATYRMFVSNSTYDGNLGGPTGADTKCNADANKPNDGTSYKALLIDAANRNACNNANCSLRAVAVL